jgi:hypothetical protein
MSRVPLRFIALLLTIGGSLACDSGEKLTGSKPEGLDGPRCSRELIASSDLTP